MKRKAIFLDIDGTYLNERGLVPESAASAVRSARRNDFFLEANSGIYGTSATQSAQKPQRP